MFFRKFQTRLFVFFILLLTLLQLLIFITVNDANIRNAKNVIHNSLEVGASIFQRLIDERTLTLFQHARLLSADYGFKPAFYSNDHETILSAMNNHLDRLEEAEIMLLVDLDGNIIANTNRPEQKSVPVLWPNLIEAATLDDYGEATEIVLIDNQPFQIIVVPYLSPDIDAWILLGFSIDQKVADDLKQMVDSEISFLVLQKEDQWRLTHTTLDKNVAESLNKLVQQPQALLNSSQILLLDQHEYVSLYTPVTRSNRLIAVLQRSLDKALAPYVELKKTLQFFFIAALFLSLLGAIFIARRVTKPVEQLTEGAKKIESGNYDTQIKVKQKDEIGRLATSFNRMSKGLAEKEKVRNLLGKVVSSDIAEELLSHDIELGGEEKEATILFSDIRDFTSLCEGYSPKEILQMLNIYLTAMSEIIDTEQGVIDKYIGDAIMAIFGAPAPHGDDANRAVAAAMAMSNSLSQLNQNEFSDRAPLAIGIGLNTAKVVAGNMGAPNRLNYTVIGDGVNLASRLEGLTKHYGLSVLVTQSTKQVANRFYYREIDRVKVKGKQQAVSIFEPIAEKSSITTAQSELINLTGQLLAAYRQKHWRNALSILTKIPNNENCRFCQEYRNRIKIFQQQPPPDDWDFTFAFTQK